MNDRCPCQCGEECNHCTSCRTGCIPADELKTIGETVDFEKILGIDLPALHQTNTKGN